jgi:hypothetical protein
MIISDPDFTKPVQYNIRHFGSAYTQSGITNGLMYVHIPKNASSYTRNILTVAGFEHCNYHREYRYSSAVVSVLRDPVKRWISGALEYLVRKYPNTTDFIDLDHKIPLFEQFEVDEHTARQTKFLHGLDTNNITFLKCDKNYESNLVHFFNKNNIALNSKIGWRNASTASPIKQKLKPLLLEKIDQAKLVEYLHPDYKLIESVEFYDPI